MLLSRVLAKRRNSRISLSRKHSVLLVAYIVEQIYACSGGIPGLTIAQLEFSREVEVNCSTGAADRSERVNNRILR